MMETHSDPVSQCRSSPARRNQRFGEKAEVGGGRRLEWEGRGGRDTGPLFPTSAPHTPLPPTRTHSGGPASAPLCLEPTSWLSEAGGWGRRGEAEGE